MSAAAMRLSQMLYGIARRQSGVVRPALPLKLNLLFLN